MDRSRGKTLFIAKEDNLRFPCICPEDTVDELDNDFDDIFDCNYECKKKACCALCDE